MACGPRVLGRGGGTTAGAAEEEDLLAFQWHKLLEEARISCSVAVLPFEEDDRMADAVCDRNAHPLPFGGRTYIYQNCPVSDPLHSVVN